MKGRISSYNIQNTTLIQRRQGRDVESGTDTETMEKLLNSLLFMGWSINL